MLAIFWGFDETLIPYYPPSLLVDVFRGSSRRNRQESSFRLYNSLTYKRYRGQRVRYRVLGQILAIFCDLDETLTLYCPPPYL